MNSALSDSIKDRLAKINFVVFDFDGVFTDNRVWVNQDGVESVACLRSDGLGLNRIQEQGIKVMILSTEVNKVVAARAGKLKLDCVHGCADKVPEFKKQVAARGFDLSETAFVGNDINDLGCLKLAGLGVVVSDAWEEVRGAADLVLTRAGGHGAVREFCDLLFMARGGYSAK